MKHPVHFYAKALAEAVVGRKASEAKIMKNFLALVRKNGDGAHLPNIIAAADRAIRGATGIRKITLASARRLSTPSKTILAGIAKRGDVIQEEVDPDLVAGIAITIDGEMRFDGSLKGKLEKMFQA